MSYNSVSDFTLHYNVKEYRELEEVFEIRRSKEGSLPEFHFLLALIGFDNRVRIPLSENIPSTDKYEQHREFSLRTMYAKNQTDMDSYYGIITILDNLEQDYDKVMYDWAFEKTSTNNKSFFELDNIRRFYEYMLGGIGILHKNVFKYDRKYVNIQDALRDIIDNVLNKYSMSNDIEEELIDIDG